MKKRISGEQINSLGVVQLQFLLDDHYELENGKAF